MTSTTDKTTADPTIPDTAPTHLETLVAMNAFGTSDTPDISRSVPNADTILAAIDVDSIPETTVKMFRLPGGSPRPDNLLTGKQLRVITDWAKHNLDPTLSWLKTVQYLRQQANIRSMNQLDFPVVEYCIVQSRKLTADEPLTVGQENLFNSCMQALAGTKTHFDAGIATRIAHADPALRNTLLQHFMRAETRGEFSRCMNMFTNLFGRPEHQGLVLDAALPGTAMGSPSEPSSF